MPIPFVAELPGRYWISGLEAEGFYRLTDDLLKILRDLAVISVEPRPSVRLTKMEIHPLQRTAPKLACAETCAFSRENASPYRYFSRLGGDGAQEKTRTSTPFRELAPEASASTNSATWASEGAAEILKDAARVNAAWLSKPAPARRSAAHLQRIGAWTGAKFFGLSRHSPILKAGRAGSSCRPGRLFIHAQRRMTTCCAMK